ncbi:hypothetical protein EJ110_NYTH29841 [Nymphaea thermarum]|nr:hypothetical protein EJ110_NYTH29841 [Nymphaea thermarum]
MTILLVEFAEILDLPTLTCNPNEPLEKQFLMNPTKVKGWRWLAATSCGCSRPRLWTKRRIKGKLRMCCLMGLWKGLSPEDWLQTLGRTKKKCWPMARSVASLVTMVGAQWLRQCGMGCPVLGGHRMHISCSIAMVVERSGLGFWERSWRGCNGGGLIKGEEIGRQLRLWMEDKHVKEHSRQLREGARRSIGVAGDSHRTLAELMARTFVRVKFHPLDFVVSKLHFIPLDFPPQLLLPRIPAFSPSHQRHRRSHRRRSDRRRSAVAAPLLGWPDWNNGLKLRFWFCC